MNSKKVKSPKLIKVPDGGWTPHGDAKLIKMPDGGWKPSCKIKVIPPPANVEEE